MRRLVVTVCPREPGRVRLPIQRGERPRWLDASDVRAALDQIVAVRGLRAHVELRDGCAGGCGAEGPNVDVTIYPATTPGARPDHVAVGWRTYVYALATLECLADVIDENLDDPASTRRRRRVR